MTIPSNQPPDNTEPSLEECFDALCWGRAYLFKVGNYPFQLAVDELQAWAQRTGLLDQIGQDRVQQIIAWRFAQVRDDL